MSKFLGFFVCCCRCCGKCGAYPKTHYDKKSDSCKRLSLGILLSFFVIAAVFGTVSAFVTNQYTYSGWNGIAKKMDDSLEDAGGYFEHAGESIEVLLVTNFAEMEEVIEQCDSKVHDGCYIFASIEEYSFNYTLGEVNLIGKGISLDVEKGCATYNNFMKNNKTIE